MGAQKGNLKTEISNPSQLENKDRVSLNSSVGQFFPKEAVRAGFVLGPRRRQGMAQESGITQPKQGGRTW